VPSNSTNDPSEKVNVGIEAQMNEESSLNDESISKSQICD